MHIHSCTHYRIGGGVCPTCGTCPTCGSRPWTAPIRPVQPIWVQPYHVHINQTINRLAGART